MDNIEFPFSSSKEIEAKRSITKVDLDSDREASVARLEELRNGRSISDIPSYDGYHKALRRHRLAYHLNQKEK